MSPTNAASSVQTGVPIALMASAGFASGSGMRLIDPLLPRLADDLATTVSGASIVIGAFMLTYGVGQLIVGPLGDRLGKTRVACAALAGYGLAMLACALATNLSSLVALRAIAGLFAGAVIPLLMAHIGDTVPYARRQEVIGRFLTGIVMAQLVTGPVSGVIGEQAGWRVSFLVLGGAVLIVAALLARGIRRSPPAERGAGGRGLGLSSYAGLLTRPAGRRLLLAASGDGLLLFGGAFPFVGAFLIETFGLTPTHSGLVVACFGAGAFAYTRLARRLLHALGERGLLTAGGAGLSVGLLILAITPSWSVACAAQLLMGVSFYMFHGVLQARATEALPEARGTAVSAFAMALFLGQSIGSVVFGAALAVTGYRVNFAAAALAMLALALWTRGRPDPAAAA